MPTIQWLAGMAIVPATNHPKHAPRTMSQTRGEGVGEARWIFGDSRGDQKVCHSAFLLILLLTKFSLSQMTNIATSRHIQETSPPPPLVLLDDALQAIMTKDQQWRQRHSQLT